MAIPLTGGCGAN